VAAHYKWDHNSYNNCDNELACHIIFFLETPMGRIVTFRNRISGVDSDDSGGHNRIPCVGSLFLSKENIWWRFLELNAFIKA
jgi:hypothetical protein